MPPIMTKLISYIALLCARLNILNKPATKNKNEVIANAFRLLLFTELPLDRLIYSDSFYSITELDDRYCNFLIDFSISSFLYFRALLLQGRSIISTVTCLTNNLISLLPFSSQSTYRKQ